MRRRPRLVGFLWRWHRRLGLVAAVFALVLAITGIALNHSSQLGLDRHYVQADWLYALYGEPLADLPAYRAGPFWVFRNSQGQIYLNSKAFAPCRGKLVGAIYLQGLTHIACAEELLLATDRGGLVESLTAGTGLPTPLLGVGRVGDRLALRFTTGWHLADLDQLDFSTPLQAGAVLDRKSPGVLPAPLDREIPLRDNWLNWERVVLDLHSGRLGGAAGVLLMDFAGLLLCLLGISGVAMWWLHRRKG